MRRFPHFPLLAVLLLLAATLSAASPSLVVIVNPDSGVFKMNKEEVARIFMGSQKRFSTGGVVLPVEPMAPEAGRVLFYRLLVNQNLAQVRTYWAQLYFSGQAQPPRQVQDFDEVVEIVASNKGAVGFVAESNVTRRVRAVLTLGGEDKP